MFKKICIYRRFFMNQTEKEIIKKAKRKFVKHKWLNPPTYSASTQEASFPEGTIIKFNNCSAVNSSPVIIPAMELPVPVNVGSI